MPDLALSGFLIGFIAASSAMGLGWLLGHLVWSHDNPSDKGGRDA